MNTQNIKLTFNRALLQVKKRSPEIMIAAGVIGTVVTTVVACKATMKVETILNESKKNRQLIEDTHDGKIGIGPDEYSDDDYKKDITINTVQTGVSLIKNYAPAATIGVVSIASILGGYNVMKKRNVALVAAYTAVNEGFKEYRGRVVERFGKEVDRELKNNIKAKKIEVAEVDENGETKIVKKKAGVIEESGKSEYARYFNKESHCWEENFDYNMMFLRAQQNLANDILRTKGHIFLNEVYDMLGLPRTQAGQLVGWVYNPDNAIGDNYVDFNLPDDDEIFFEHMCDESEKIYSRAIPLDFNVDGYVLELI